KRDVGGDQLEVVTAEAEDLGAAAAMLERATGAAVSVDVPARRATAPTSDGVAALAAVAVELQEAELAVEDLGVRRPTLDDVFLTLTGAATSESPAPADAREPEGALR